MDNSPSHLSTYALNCRRSQKGDVLPYPIPMQGIHTKESDLISASLGVIPNGFRMKDGHYEDICPYFYVLYHQSRKMAGTVNRKGKLTADHDADIVVFKDIQCVKPIAQTPVPNGHVQNNEYLLYVFLSEHNSALYSKKRS